MASELKAADKLKGERGGVRSKGHQSQQGLVPELMGGMEQAREYLKMAICP